MKKFKITITWTMAANLEIEAADETEAIEKGYNHFYSLPPRKYPKDSDYATDSCEVFLEPEN